MGRALVAFPLISWGLLAALSFSFVHDSQDACESHAFWTTGWFFLPPLLTLPGFAASRPMRAGALLGSIALLGFWSLFSFLWFISSISCGA